MKEIDKMIIDMENHLSLRERVETGHSASGKICERYWGTDGRLKIRLFEDAARIERTIQFMNDCGIDMAVLSTNALDTLEEMKKWNDLCAGLIREYPDRLAGFASVPTLGGKPALDELERAIKELGLKGVHIWSQCDGHAIDSRELWPFYEKVAELGVPIDVHISERPQGFDALHAPYGLYYIVARELDMVATTLRVCLGGVLEDFPDLILIMNHFGGGVSTVMERFDAYLNYTDQTGWPEFYYKKRLITRPWREYFNKLYFNMAGREVGMETVKAALTNISPQKLMFASDWPFNYDYQPQRVKQYIEEIRKLGLPQEDIDAMLGGTAARLLGIQRKR
jgi:predicted TIM-barrel fold metal-dependent hydrolase